MPHQLEHELILAHILNVDRSFFIAHPSPQLSPQQKKEYEKLKSQYDAGEPLPYIIHQKDFYGRTFYVDERVLIPRPETELMIDLLKQSAQHTETIIDIGTGSGCIAITAKLEIPSASVYASDISPDALHVAEKNAVTLNARVTFAHGNLCEPFFDLFPLSQNVTILANLPYIPSHEYSALDPRVLREPKSALDGGTDGLQLYQELFAQINSLAFHSPLKLLCEIMPDQKNAITALISHFFPHALIEFHQDLQNLTRVCMITV